MRGEGTRKALTLATAESIEIEFTSPDGASETVRRQTLDLIGPADRAAATTLTADDIRKRREEVGIDLTQNLYDLLFTTGHDVAVVDNLVTGERRNVIAAVPTSGERGSEVDS